MNPITFESGDAMSMSQSERDPVEQLAEEFVERYRCGEFPTVEDYAAQYPQWSEKIHELFPALVMIERHKPRPEIRSLLGEQLGDYILIREIGRGGMGIVYEAEQVSLHRRVAVKVLPAATNKDQEERAYRFQREARAAARLHHTNIVPIMGVGEQQGTHYYVMQFIEGLTLHEVIHELHQQRYSTDEQSPQSDNQATKMVQVMKNSSLEEAATLINGRHPSTDQMKSPSESVVRNPNAPETGKYSDSVYWHNVARIGIQVADGLHYAHEQGILHRDIKPANLLIDSESQVWITDFGLAKLVDEEDITNTGHVLGTLRYMAPERYEGSADARSDVYSLGLTLYEMLTLQPAFPDSSREQVIHHILTDEPPSPEKVNPQVPIDLGTIVSKSIAHDPAHRYQTARQLREDLQRFLDDKPILARPATPLDKLWRWAKRNRGVAIWASVSVLMLILVAVVSSVAFVRTNHALDRAENTLNISLNTLDDVYQHFLADLKSSAQGTLPLTPETAKLLGSLLKAYDDFAKQESNNPQLREASARANRRVGELRASLGQYKAAEQAYKEAIRRYQFLYQQTGNNDYQLEIARIYRAIGGDAFKPQSDQEGKVALQNAESILNSMPSTFEVKYELAYTWLALGRRPKPGLKPGAQLDEPITRKRYLDLAIELLTGLLQQTPKDASCRHLLALCYREKAESTSDSDTRKAIEMLDLLVKEYPDRNEYRFELIESYATADIRHTEEIAQLILIKDWLEKALEHSEKLLSRHPYIAIYNISRIHLLNKLSTVTRKLTRLVPNPNEQQRAEAYLKEAIQLQLKLIKGDPDSMVHHGWLARLRGAYARSLREDAREMEASQVLRESIAPLEDLLSRKQGTVAIKRILAENQEDLARMLRRIGQVDEAEVLFRKAESFFANNPQRMRRPPFPPPGRRFGGPPPE